MLSWGLYKNLLYNFHQGNLVGRLFEIGKSFSLKDPAEFTESPRLAAIAWGHNPNLWNKQQAPVVIELKSAIEKLLESFQISAYRWVSVENKSEVPGFLHAGQMAILEVEGKKIGFVGTLHPVILDKDKIRAESAICEINLEPLYKSVGRSKKFDSISKFPAVERDLSLVMQESLAAGDLIKEIKKLAGAKLVSVQIFDFYAGERLEKGKKSVSFRLKFQDKNATLQDELINQAIDQVLKGLEQKYSIFVR
jgi:phenylalanyl-tRNA synthetase beta chain